MGAIFFLASGALVASRCAQLAPARPEGDGRGRRRRFGLTITGVAVAWISGVALVGPLLVDREIDSSNTAAAADNLPSAISKAETAHSIEPWAASPYKQLGLLAELRGDYPEAIHRYGQAIDSESENWLLYYLRARAANLAGNSAAAQRRPARSPSPQPRRTVPRRRVRRLLMSRVSHSEQRERRRRAPERARRRRPPAAARRPSRAPACRRRAAAAPC